MKGIHLVIYGQPARKSNSRRIVRDRRTGRWMIIKSAEALHYEETFERQVPQWARQRLGSQKHPLELQARVFMRHKWTSDLSLELIQDCLEKADVISDDRYIVRKVSEKKWDRREPRVELWIRELDEWEWGN